LTGDCFVDGRIVGFHRESASTCLPAYWEGATESITMFKHTSLILSTALAIGLVLSPVNSMAGPRDTFTVALAARVLPSTVTIDATDSFDRESIGSGFIIDRSGLVLTNEHVITGAETIKVKVYGDKDFNEATLIFVDPGNDLAVLRIKSNGKTYPELELGPSSDLKVGEPAIAIGSPFGEEFTVSQGIISKLHVLLPWDEGDVNRVRKYLIQTDAAINPGNSGGPLFNAEGEVVGINELKKGAAGIGWAITANRATRVLSVALSASNVAGILHGIKSVELKVLAPTGDDRQAVIVKELEAAGPASEVLQVGDRIFKIEDRYIRNAFDLERSLWSHKAGDQVKVVIIRLDQMMEVTLTVADAKATESKD